MSLRKEDREVLIRLEKHLRLVIKLDPADRGDKEINEAERHLLGELEALNDRIEREANDE